MCVWGGGGGMASFFDVHAVCVLWDQRRSKWLRFPLWTYFYYSEGEFSFRPESPEIVMLPLKTFWFCLLDIAELGIHLVSFRIFASWKFRAKSPSANVNHTTFRHTHGPLVCADLSLSVFVVCLSLAMAGEMYIGVLCCLLTPWEKGNRCLEKEALFVSLGVPRLWFWVQMAWNLIGENPRGYQSAKKKNSAF